MDKYAKYFLVSDIIYSDILENCFMKNIAVKIKFEAIIQEVKIPPIEFLKCLKIYL